MFVKTLRVPATARAFILQGDKATEVPQGEYEIEGFFTRLNHLLRDQHAEILVTRTGALPVSFSFDDVATCEHLLVSARFTVSVRIENVPAFARHFMTMPGAIGVNELRELLAHPVRHSRDAARYLRDCFDYYGSYELPRPFGATRRFRLFDQEFRDQADGGHIPLIGHEELQNGFYRALSNFAREGRANRLVLLHGPNGSAKSTFADCIMRALEHYSMADDGALYRFSWIFAPASEERTIGFTLSRGCSMLCS